MRDVEPLLRPKTVAVIGASGTRQTQGNGVIRNLKLVGYAGRIIPVHPTASEIDGLPTVRSIADLPRDTDAAVVAIPAPSVVGVLAELDQADVRSAVVFSNGFPAAEEEAFKALATRSRMAIHGPNCMGLINLTDPLRLYPSTVTDKVHRGPVALIAQSGSAAISLVNSTAAGVSKVVTMGNEWQVAAPDYMQWFATDATTSVVGVVLELIKDPAAFADAARQLRDAGKGLVVLKVGRSPVGVAAVRAHTGAMISPNDAYECFFESCGIPIARDYDELIASIECFAGSGKRPRGGRTAIIGISGGETALACDVATDQGLTLACWSSDTEGAIRAALPGAAGVNPLDLGSTPNHNLEQDEQAIAAILNDEGVDQLLVVQDCQATLTPTMRGNYTPRITAYGRYAASSDKPFVMVSPTGENTHPEIMQAMAEQGVPVLRGMRPGVVALRNLGVWAEQPPYPWQAPCPSPSPFAEEIARHHGPLPAELCTRILDAYDIPTVRSALVGSVAEAIDAAQRIGFPTGGEDRFAGCAASLRSGGCRARHRGRIRAAYRIGADASARTASASRRSHRRVRTARRNERLPGSRYRLYRRPAIRLAVHDRDRRCSGGTGVRSCRRSGPGHGGACRISDRPHPSRPPACWLSRDACRQPAKPRLPIC